MLRAETRVVLGDFPAAVLRGALGGALRTAACTTGAPACTGCPLLASCAYGLLFENVPLPGVLHSGFTDVPRPYVLHLTRPLPAVVSPGHRFAFDLVLVESAATTLPVLVRAVRRLETTGLGDDRERGQGRVRLQRVEVRHGPAPVTAWMPGRRLLPAVPAPVPLGATPCPDAADAALDLRFVSPLRLCIDGQTRLEPAFEDVVRALARRVQALAALHGRYDDALRERLYGWIDLTRGLDAVPRFRSVVRRRYSARQRQRVPLEGVVGTIRVGPGWQPLWPLLDAGRLLHVGKNATHGFGQYRLHVVPHHQPIAS